MSADISAIRPRLTERSHRITLSHSQCASYLQAEAQKALELARASLLEARRHVEALEREARGEAVAAQEAARLASAKLAEASEVSAHATI